MAKSTVSMCFARYPSILRQVAIAKTEPGDENNQDISSLVGKVDIRKLESCSHLAPHALQPTSVERGSDEVPCHVARLWGFDVILETVDENGEVSTTAQRQRERPARNA